MTTPNDALIEEVREMVERLNRKVHRGHYMPGGGSFGIDAEGKTTSKMWGGEKIMELANPDGPDAAALITRLMEGRG